MSDLYRDAWITCAADAIHIRWYYPWGSKTVPYSRIRGAELVRMAVFAGKGRIWGTANPRYWASLDPRRRSKELALILDVGGPVRPYLTPDDPRAVAEIVKERTGLSGIPELDSGPVI